LSELLNQSNRTSMKVSLFFFKNKLSLSLTTSKRYNKKRTSKPSSLEVFCNLNLEI
jgi:hypothetical protein